MPLDPDVAAAGTARGLFRQANLDRLASPERLDLAAIVVRPASWLMLAVATMVIAAAAACSVTIAVPIKVDSEGMLLSPTGVHEVDATERGQLRSLLVHLGDRVEAGSAIAMIAQPDLQQDMQQAADELKDAQERLTVISAFQARVAATQAVYRAQERNNLQATITFTQRRLGWLQERLRDQEMLKAKGLETGQTMLQSRVDLGQAQEDLAHSMATLKQLDVEENTQRTEQERERLDLVLKVSAAARHLGMLRERMGRIDTVTSPYTGVIAELKMNEGEVIERGQALVVIIPADAVTKRAASHGNGPPIPLMATLYVNPKDGKRVESGMAVEVIPSTVKREEFGFIRGRVISVAQVPATQEGMLRALKNRQLVEALSHDGAPFEVRAELETSPDTVSGFRWSSSGGPDIVLTGGSPCRGEIVTRRDTLLKLLLPPLQRLLSLLV